MMPAPDGFVALGCSCTCASLPVECIRIPTSILATIVDGPECLIGQSVAMTYDGSPPNTGWIGSIAPGNECGSSGSAACAGLPDDWNEDGWTVAFDCADGVLTSYSGTDVILYGGGCDGGGLPCTYGAAISTARVIQIEYDPFLMLVEVQLETNTTVSGACDGNPWVAIGDTVTTVVMFTEL